MAELMHDVYLEEYPQSGDRVRGKQNARGVYENYPSMPNLIDFSYSISGDLAVVEMVVDYDGHRMNACQICDGPARLKAPAVRTIRRSAHKVTKMAKVEFRTPALDERR
jgi:hypothetical protein